MNTTLKLIGAGGSHGLPPITATLTPTTAQVDALAPVAQPVLAPANSACLLQKRVSQAGRDFLRQAIELIESEKHSFYLKLCITFNFIMLKIGNKDAYVDEVLAELTEKYKDAWVPAKTTLQHYEGPMLCWLAKVARQNYPNDPNLVGTKFTTTFLRKNPHYILGTGAPELKKLHKDCKTLVKLDHTHGNGRVKPPPPKL